MSDCSTHAFDVPTCERGILHEPERPTLKRLAKVHGEPPWTLTMPYPDILPQEALEFIGTVNVGGVAFKRFDQLDEKMLRIMFSEQFTRAEDLEELVVDMFEESTLTRSIFAPRLVKLGVYTREFLEEHYGIEFEEDGTMEGGAE